MFKHKVNVLFPLVFISLISNSTFQFYFLSILGWPPKFRGSSLAIGAAMHMGMGLAPVIVSKDRNHKNLTRLDGASVIEAVLWNGLRTYPLEFSQTSRSCDRSWWYSTRVSPYFASKLSWLLNGRGVYRDTNKWNLPVNRNPETELGDRPLPMREHSFIRLEHDRPEVSVRSSLLYIKMNCSSSSFSIEPFLYVDHVLALA